MDELFGAPVTSIAAVLAIVFGVAMAFLLFIRLRNPILVKMAFRNALRRPGQSLLILMGLMLATAIISSAFTIGDSVTYSIKNIATESLRSLDELLVVDEDSELWEGRTLPEGFSEEVFAELALRLDADPDIDAALPALTEDVAVINEASRQFESGALLAGLDLPVRQPLRNCSTLKARPSTSRRLAPTRPTSPRTARMPWKRRRAMSWASSWARAR